MLLTTDREAPLAACRLAARLLPERVVCPAEGHLLLRAGHVAPHADPGIRPSCTLHSVGAEASLRLPLAAQVERPGEALLPARPTLALLRASSSAEVAVEANSDGLVVRWPGARCRLESPPVACFEADEAAPGGPCRLVQAGLLARVLRSVLFASGVGGRRYRLDGVLVESEPDRLRVVATDNRRLAVAELATPEQPEAPAAARTCVLPAVAVDLLARLADGAATADADAVVELRLGDGDERASFRVGGGTLTCRRDAGPFPPWRSAVPADPPHRIDVPVAGLLDAVRQAAVLREQAGAKLLLTLEPGRLVLESGRAGAGSARVSRKLSFTGGPVRVALEPRFVEEMLRCLESEAAVEIGLTDPDTPARFRAGGYVHVLMPLTAG